ncbi:CHAT domain-containing protein [Armatimonas sp.]|uniref:CHAT domain-containing protein n=1 Tax=Armatimonas sp. TaxID=1872638 RepID=UPI00286D2E92|nr:CHAT domain-containing protein [Armatimonas sp.]
MRQTLPTPEALDLLRRQAGEARAVLNYDQAIALNRRRVEGGRKRGNLAEAVAALIEISRDSQANFQPVAAFASLYEAHTLQPGDASISVALGDLYTELHLREQAIAVYETAGNFAADRLMRAYLGKGDTARARLFLNQDRQRLQQEKNLRGEANLLVAWGDPATYTEAVELLARALPTASFRDQAQMLGLRATLFGLLKRPDEARQCFVQQLMLCDLHLLWQERFAALGAYASFEYFYGEKPKARALLQTYQAKAQELQSPRDERGALQKRLDFAGYESNWPEVAAICTETIVLCVAQGWRSELPYLQARHAEAFQKLGKRPEAAAACRAAIATLEQHRRTYAGLDAADQAFRQGNRAPYERLLSLLPQKSPESFPLVQKLKARVLREQLAMGRAPQETPSSPEEKALRVRCEQLNAALVREGIANDIGGKKRFTTLQAELRAAESALARFYDTLHARSPQTALRHVASEPTLAQVQARLGPQELLLDFAWAVQGEEKVYVLAIRRERFQLVKLEIGLTELQLRITRLRHACSNPERPWQEAAKAVREALLAPLEPWLKGADKVTLCPDGVLWEVPFAVLLEQVPLSYAFSAALWHTQRTLPPLPPRPIPLLAVAAPNLAGWNRPIIAPERPIIAPERPIIAPERPIIAPERSAFLPVELPGTAQEVQTLARLFPKALVLEGKKAQESQVKTEAVRCRWLHIATHAFLNDAAPYLSCLVLSDPDDPTREDGFLTARELLGLDLSGVELATLSACNTARGETLTGEGVRGLSWALTAAGARNLILSQWSIQDEATVVWMTAFYTALKRGQSKPDALRHAAQSVRKAPDRSHPYYWAAFLLIGSGL